MAHKLLPDSISGIQRFEFLDEQEARILSQIQGRTYANMFAWWSASSIARFWN
jgi:hypothetical protein